MSTLYDQVRSFIRSESLLHDRQSLLIGVSGGGDSLCLLDCLVQLGYHVIVAHLDHKLRPESGEEAAFVEAVAMRYGIPFMKGEAEVEAYSAEISSLEEAARLARYRFLVQAAREKDLGVIATGHTADDQAETVLMHLLRGAGPSGLAGIRPEQDLGRWAGFSMAEGISLVRPLLRATRAQTHEHCRDVGLVPRQDKSNLDPNFYRNRLRHHLLPILETYNPAIRDVLIRTAEVMAAEVEFMEQQVDRRWSAVVYEASPQAIVFRRERFLDQPLAVQRSILRRAAFSLRLDLRDFGFEHVDRGIAFIRESRAGKQWHIGGGLVLTSMYDDVVLTPEGGSVPLHRFPQCESCEVRVLSPIKEQPLKHGWELQLHLEPSASELPAGLYEKDVRSVEAFDANGLRGDLILRCPREGDRLHPFGMDGEMKVADLFVNHRVPRAARRRWPIIADSSQILWVVGLRRSSAAPIVDSTKKRLVMRLVPPEEGEHV